MSKPYRVIQSSMYEGRVSREEVAAAMRLISQNESPGHSSKKAGAKKLAAKKAPAVKRA